MYVKELLIEALCRTKNCERGFPVNATNLKTAENYFNAALRKYSGNNLITAFQRVFNYTPLTEESVVGKPTFKRGRVVHYCKKVSDIPSAATLTAGKDYCICDYNTTDKYLKVENGAWVPCELSEFADFVCDEFCWDMGRVVKLMIKENGRWNDVDFVPLTEFYSDERHYRYNASEAGENKANIIVSEEMVNKELKLIYNTSMKFTSKDYIELPEDQIELLTLAVQCGMLMEDNEDGGSRLANTKAELKELEDQIGAKNCTTRRIVRSSSSRDRSIVTGSFLFR